MIQGCDEEEDREEDGNNQARNNLYSLSAHRLFCVCQSTCEHRQKLKPQNASRYYLIINSSIE